MKQKIFLKFVCALGVGLALSSCKKWELKQPASLSMNWKFNNTSTSNNAVQINSGYFYASEFSLNGSREEGEDVSITKSIISTKFSFSESNYLNFNIDVPMGDYKNFDVGIKLDNSQSESPIRLYGSFTKDSVTYPVKIEWVKLDLLQFHAINAFSLIRKKSYNLYICMDVQKLLDNISSNFWMSASMSMENGVPTLIVNESTNANLYSKINTNLSSALTIQVEKQ